MSLDRLLATDHRWMRVALHEAQKAFEEGEVPVGAVIVHHGEIVGRGYNRVEQLKDPTAHAEILAITAACETLGSKFLTDCTLYVTLEPCPMCAGATVLARLKRLVFGAYDEKWGSASTLYNIPRDPRFNHQVEVIAGVEAEASAALLQQFFQQQRRS